MKRKEIPCNCFSSPIYLRRIIAIGWISQPIHLYFDCMLREVEMYSFFAKMVDYNDGMLQAMKKIYQNAENGKRRTYYQITDQGREYYRMKCEEWKLTKEVIESFISQ